MPGPLLRCKASQAAEASIVNLQGSFTGLANTGSTNSDSYILLKFLKSRDMVERLEKDMEFRAACGAEKADRISRLGSDQDIELVVEYWEKRVETNFDCDNASGIIPFDVEAFSTDGARKIADRVLAHSREMVNRLSEEARRNAVSYAEGEVARAEKRLRDIFEQVRTFRAREQAIDPAALAKAQIIAGLDKQLAETQARIAVIEGSVEENSPALRNLRRQREALKRQIGEESAEVSKNSRRGHTPALSDLLAVYQII